MNRQANKHRDSARDKLRVAARNFFLALDEFLIRAEIEKTVAEPSRMGGARLLDINAAAVYMGRTPRALRHMIEKGVLPVIRIDSKLMLDRARLDELIDTQES